MMLYLANSARMMVPDRCCFLQMLTMLLLADAEMMLLLAASSVVDFRKSFR